MEKRGSSTINYASYNLPTYIDAVSKSSSLYYGAFRNRYKQVAVAGGISETTVYVGALFERMTPSNGPTEYRHYVPGGNGVASIVTRRSNGTSDTYYVHADHLGSPEVFTGSAGQQLVRPSFGAYGERRDGSDWSGPVSLTDLAIIEDITRGGFTGHEHLDAVGLIHMNGRVYDPLAGRFLGVDPIVHIGNSQSPNSYSYVWNNPLTMIDPSGYNGEVTGNGPPPAICTPGSPFVTANCPYWSSGNWDLGPGGRETQFEINKEIYAERRSYGAYVDNNRPDRKPVRAMYGEHLQDGIVDWRRMLGYLFNDVAHADQGRSISIADSERALAAAGDVEGFWRSRQAQGDPIANVALSSLRPSGGVIDYLFGGESVNTRLEAFSRVYAGRSVDFAAVRLDLVNAHIAAVDADRQGVLGLLSPGQVYDYHRDVFARLGFPASTFGGSPFTGARWEATATRVFWCLGCDR